MLLAGRAQGVNTCGLRFLCGRLVNDIPPGARNSAIGYPPLADHDGTDAAVDPADDGCIVTEPVHYAALAVTLG